MKLTCKYCSKEFEHEGDRLDLCYHFDIDDPKKVEISEGIYCPNCHVFYTTSRYERDKRKKEYELKLMNENNNKKINI